jgi:dGTPase
LPDTPKEIVAMPDTTATAAHTLNLRAEQEAWELTHLSGRAAKSALSRGRAEPRPEDELRTAFQRDRDRVLHSKPFRRLKDKTQVFIAPSGAHYRTRLTHTLEVTQVSRTIGRALRLNEDLIEAIGLSHDFGHPAFGHCGEAALNAVVPGGFKHNHQSVRVVEVIERMNLTWEVRDGILGHTGEHMPETLEGQIVRTADRIAYLNHDIDDAIRAGVLRLEDLPRKTVKLLGDSHGARIATLVKDMVMASRDADRICFSPEIQALMDELRAFMFERVYLNPAAKSEDVKATRVVQSLYHDFIEHPEHLAKHLGREITDDELIQTAVDYVAGMTDTFAIRTYENRFLPRPYPV